MAQQSECPSESDRRKHCDMVIAMNTKFNSFMDRYEEDREESRRWRDGVMSNLRSITEELASLRPGYKAGLWIVVTIVGGSLIALFTRIIEAIKIR